MTAAGNGEHADGVRQALLRAAACSLKQGVIGIAMTAALALIALQLRAYTWLALFGALLLPLAGARWACARC